MKIKIEKIVSKEIEIIRYLSDDIFEFKLNSENLYEEKIKLFQEKVNEEGSREIELIDREIERNGYGSKRTREELMKNNLHHVYKAGSYFTNGQKIISVVRTATGIEIGRHKNFQVFGYYFSPSLPISTFSLENFDLQSFQLKEKVETEVVRELANLEVRRIPMSHNSEFDFVEVRFVYPLTYNFRIDDMLFARTLGQGKPDSDSITVEIIKSIRPRVLLCCRNCVNFQYSGMSHDMSGGTVGYCKMFREKLTEKSVRESTTHIWNWCEKFKRNEKI